MGHHDAFSAATALLAKLLASHDELSQEAGATIIGLLEQLRQLADFQPSDEAIENGWIYTVSGEPAHLLRITPGDFNREVVAHTLAGKTRFGAQTKDCFYLVGQHCILGAERFLNGPEYRHLPSERRQHLARLFLMHEGDEVFLPEIPTPLKDLIPWWKRLSEPHMEACMQAFGLPWPWHPDDKALIKLMDGALFATERDQLVPKCSRPSTRKVPPTLAGLVIEPMSMEETEQAFLALFDTLFPEHAPRLEGVAP